MDKIMTNDGQNNDFGTELFNIDERLQEVLGHCRKYFQEVPLPNSHCVNFGKYGSFLPDCQHSPCNSPFHDISQSVLSCNVSKSPQAVPLDNGCPTSCGDVKPLPRKNGPDTTTITSRARHNVSGEGSVICASDQFNRATPKIHIKLDGETCTTSKTKRILQSLGLDMSSSSSEGDSPICERRFTGSAGEPTASPEHTTTPPILEDVFLSPLPDTLISLIETSREVDRNSCESISRNSNPLIGDVSCLYDVLEYKTMSSNDICDRFDSVEKTVVQYLVCPNSPAKHFSPEPRGMSTSLTEMENMTSKDPEDDAKDGSVSSPNERNKILLKYGRTDDNGNENLFGKKKIKTEHPHEIQKFPDSFHYDNFYMPENSGAKGMECCRKNQNMESFDENEAKFMTKEGENIQLQDDFKAEKPSVEASVLSKVSAISKDENYVDALKISPLRSEASCLISSPRECSVPQNVSTSNPCEVQHMTISSPVELQKSTDEANKAIIEADDLKYCAKDLKSSGLLIESTEVFFQAALKYLDAASRLETHVSGSANNVALTPFKIYGTTAKLLRYCAQEYESCKDMACAALAYKCLEASNMQIVYSTDDNARRDCQELQVSLQALTSGTTSPLTNTRNDYTKNQKCATTDISNGFSSSQLTESYPLDSRSRSMFVQLLNFAQCADSAMEASRKSQITFGYASEILEETEGTEVVDCMKRALNYGFHDMKKLLHLVYEAMEALSS